MRLRVCRPIVSASLAVWLLLAGCATAPTEFREPPPLAAAERTAFNLKVYDAAWSIINRRYFDARFRGVDWPAMRAKHRPAAAAAHDDAELYRVLDQLCAELKESHLISISPRYVHDIKTDHRPAVGMTWTVIDGKRVIVETLPGSPAEAAGIQPGWIAETRDGQPLNETTQYVARLNHPITFGFRDLQDRPVTLQLSPQLLRFDRLVARQLEGGVRYLRFDRFSVQSLRWLSQQLKEHRPAPAAIVDLRRNPGGTLFAALATVEEFFDHSVPAGEFVRRDGRTRATKGISLFSAKYPGRVIVLIGPGSASSSEIVAHVLQQQKRATIIGQRSAGAVIASEFFSLPGGGRLQVPIQDYIGVDGRRLEGRSVTPDIVTPRPTVAEIRAGRDLEIEAALTELRKEALIGRN